MLKHVINFVTKNPREKNPLSNDTHDIKSTTYSCVSVSISKLFNIIHGVTHIWVYIYFCETAKPPYALQCALIILWILEKHKAHCSCENIMQILTPNRYNFHFHGMVECVYCEYIMYSCEAENIFPLNYDIKKCNTVMRYTIIFMMEG